MIKFWTILLQFDTNALINPVEVIVCKAKTGRQGSVLDPVKMDDARAVLGKKGLSILVSGILCIVWRAKTGKGEACWIQLRWTMRVQY